MNKADRIADILAEHGIGWGDVGGIGDALVSLLDLDEQLIADTIKQHAQDMRGYTIPGAANNFGTGYDHALGLLERDADFIAYRLTHE